MSKFKFDAFDVLAGSSCGTWTLRETAYELIEITEKLLGENSQYDMWKELAGIQDDDVEVMHDIINDCLESLDQCDIDHLMPASCRIAWQDNEIMVIPYVDGDYRMVDDLPTGFVTDIVYVVNDHGNVECYEWQDGGYVNQWGMV